MPTVTVQELRAGHDPAARLNAFKDACAEYPTGVTVVTTRDDAGEPVGLTVNSFTSVSLEPPMVLVCIAADANCHPHFRATGRFAVHVLGAHQRELATRFATSGLTGTEKIGDELWSPGQDGIPLLRDFLARFECRLGAVYSGGDHDILLGSVEGVAIGSRHAALGYHRRGFTTIATGG